MRRPPVQTPEERATSALKEFKRLNPTSFSGTEDPSAARNWLTQISWILNTLAIADDLRVTLATYQLEVNAYEWREAKSLIRNHEPMTWEEFSAVFLARYFPKTVKEARKREFLNIQQGSDTVAQYAMRYIDLMQFVPWIAANEEEKIQHFENGLMPFLQRQVAGLGGMT